jgi:hypothetical protein
LVYYYHVAPNGLPVGHIVQPGSWGNLTRQFRNSISSPNTFNDMNILAWESVLETARRATNAALPSRLNCVFACETEANAITFRDDFRAGHSVYQAEVTAGQAVHRGDYDIISNSTAGHPFIDTYVNGAIAYWQDAPTGLVECLIEGPAKITKLVA